LKDLPIMYVTAYDYTAHSVPPYQGFTVMGYIQASSVSAGGNGFPANSKQSGGTNTEAFTG